MTVEQKLGWAWHAATLAQGRFDDADHAATLQELRDDVNSLARATAEAIRVLQMVTERMRMTKIEVVE